MSYPRFCGLPDSASIPGRTTVWTCELRIGEKENTYSLLYHRQLVVTMEKRLLSRILNNSQGTVPAKQDLDHP